MPTLNATADLTASSTLAATAVVTHLVAGAAAGVSGAAGSVSSDTVAVNLVSTSTLTASATVYGPGSVLNPVEGTSPESVDFADGTPTGSPQQGDATSNDLWYRIHSTTTSVLTLDWAGSFSIGIEVFIAPSGELAQSVDDLTLQDFGSTFPFAVDTGEDVYYYVRIHPLDDANNAGTGTLSWSFAARAAGTVQVDVSETVYDTPAWVLVSVTSATESSDVEVEIDGVLVITIQTDESGQAIGFTVPTGELLDGGHTVLIRDVITGQTATETFTVVNLRADPDAPPTPGTPGIPPSSDPVVRWVFRDPLQPVEDAYTFPNNPSQMSSPHAARAITMDHTTHPGGQPLLFEGEPLAQDWNIEGAVFEQADVEALEGFLALNRRIWVVDHLQRAWVCTVESIDWIELKDVHHPWAQKYKMRLAIYDGPVALT